MNDIESSIKKLAEKYNIQDSEIIYILENLNKSEQNLQSVISSLNDIVLELNEKLIFTNIWCTDENKQFFPEKDILGKSIDQVFGNTDFKILFETVINDVFTNGKTKSFEYESIIPNDERYFEAKVTLIKSINSDSKKISIVISDISQRKKGEFAIIKAKEEADRANKLKSEFLANMSHEIRTPMNAILGFAELLKDKIKEPKYENYLSGIITGGKNLLSIINDILDLSKIESGKIEIQFEYFNINTLAVEVKQIFEMKAKEKGIKFNVINKNQVPDMIFLDETRIRQILINLIGNAFKFTSEGSVSLILDAAFNKANKIDLLIQIKDTGIGIPKDQIKIIFDAFRQREGQNTRKYGGTGLGLTITKRLIQLMNGTISVESEIDEGSTFSVSFKDISVSTEDIPQQIQIEIPKKPESEVIEFQEQIILVAEDIETNRMVVRGYLENTNLKIIEAENGEDAYEMSKIYKPNLIFMDIQMPVMDGFEASKKIKQEPFLNKIPIIALTASVMQDQVDTISGICDGYLRKPLSRAELFRVLKLHLAHNIKQNKPISAETTNCKNEVSNSDYIIDNNLLKKLKGEELLKWNNVKNGMMIDEIMDFANELIALAKEYNSETLENYGKELYESADAFKIEKMNKKLEFYPELVKIFKTDKK